MGGPNDDSSGEGGRRSVARDYYRALDDGDYERLASLLAADFVHDRPDVTLEGRERFVRFMREERPETDTTHPIDGVYRGADGEVLVRGRLLDSDGDRIVGFVDRFRIEDEAIQRITTYTR